MRVDRLPSGADLGFTDSLRPGVGRAVGGRVGDCAVTFTGGSLVPTVQPGVVWVPDTAGTFTGLAGGMLRQVVAAATPLAALAVNAGANPRVDLIVARAGNAWGGTPTLTVRQGAATANANARNLIGAAGLQAGDVPLLAVVVPSGSANPAAVAPLASTGNAEDCRVLAADLTPAGVSQHFGGTTPPIGYKLEDGADWSGRADGPWAELFAAIANTHGTPVAGRFNMPHAGGRSKVGSGTPAGNGASTNRTPGTSGGVETVTLTGVQSAVRDHAHGVNDPWHGHSVNVNVNGGGNIGVTYVATGVSSQISMGGLAIGNSGPTGVGVNGSGNTDNASAHANMHPFVAMPSIIHL